MKVTFEVPDKKVLIAFNTLALSSDFRYDEMEILESLVKKYIKKGELEIDPSLFDYEDVIQLQKALGMMVVIHVMEKRKS